MKQKLSILAFLSFNLLLGFMLMYSVAGHKDVTKGISESLRIGVTR